MKSVPHLAWHLFHGKALFVLLTASIMLTGCGPKHFHEKPHEASQLSRTTYERQMRAGPSGIIPPGALLNAQEQRRKLEQSSSSTVRLHSRFATPSQVPWTPLGPQPTASGCVGYSGVACNFGIGPFPEAGRVTAIAIDPSDVFGNTVYIGTAAGGVWKTVDGGQTLIPITDNQDSLHIGALTVDPTNPLTVYAGLGVQDQTDDSFFGLGILKSTDAGVSWRLLTDPAGTMPIITNTMIRRVAERILYARK